MTEKLDAIIFGATGFAGQTAVENALEVFHGLRWGIAGRNLVKLENVLKKLSQKIDKDLSYVTITLADVEDENSIKEMAKKCKVLVNFCGPYYTYGEVVVKACIDVGTHYVDISAEPQFIDRMALKYHDLAKTTHTFVISACGFNSVAAEMGVVYAERNFPGTVNSIETYWENTVDFKDQHSKALLHTGTWQSAIQIISNAKELLAIKNQMKPKDYPDLKPVLRVCPYPHKVPPLNNYFIPLMSGDHDTVLNTQRLWFENEKKRPLQYENYIGFKSLLYAIAAPVFAILIALLCQFCFTRKLLLKFPQIFSLGLISPEGPTEANMNSHYFQMYFKIKGWAKGKSLGEKPKQQLWTCASGYNPFYATTGVTALAGAKMMLQELEKLPGRGGVISPGYAFSKTSIIEDLQKFKYGIKYEVVKPGQ
ncbi:saccharopine dehydrogenase-like oxidoreductase [Anastrepha obliqua]|uniref:saccharopine dehydrogenase-like oxidoreductase n=1 Tax=Anastrepha obliqua TaxID=95512 RepID=UPI0024098C50|nr:saccharopine dehydrogenase-like oxidoreductase [Anastrepha obliqua]